MGAGSFADPWIEAVRTEIDARHKRPSYAGRVAAASPATGALRRHVAEQQKFIDAALSPA